MPLGPFLLLFFFYFILSVRDGEGTKAALAAASSQPVSGLGVRV